MRKIFFMGSLVHTPGYTKIAKLGCCRMLFGFPSLIFILKSNIWRHLYMLYIVIIYMGKIASKPLISGFIWKHKGPCFTPSQNNTEFSAFSFSFVFSNILVPERNFTEARAVDHNIDFEGAPATNRMKYGKHNCGSLGSGEFATEVCKKYTEVRK